MTFVFIILSLLPSFAWLMFFLKEDLHPEPKKMIFAVFVWGALMTIPAAYFEKGVLDFLQNNFGMNNLSSLNFSLFPVIEEILKFIAAYLIVRRSKYFDEPVDAMIYMVTAGLGFAMVENIGTVYNIVGTNVGPETFTALVSTAISVLVLRFVGATLLHALSSGVLGYYWAKSKVAMQTILLGESASESQYYSGSSNIFSGWILIFFGIILASVLHAIFNYLIMTIGNIIFYPTIFLIVISLLVFWDFEKIKRSPQNL